MTLPMWLRVNDARTCTHRGRLCTDSRPAIAVGPARQGDEGLGHPIAFDDLVPGQLAQALEERHRKGC